MALDAPHEVVALVAGLLLTMAVTVWWKVSVHTAVAYGWWAALLFLCVGAVGWSRVSPRWPSGGAASGGIRLT
ncbi:hypothetical protein [Streptomyces sp. LN590]|uniref:hypothetical protein n=1 Tax=unclassified Streptomyces TaxID=2593676 RepID=UPI003712FB49